MTTRADLVGEAPNLTPSLDEVTRLILTERKGNCVPVYVEMPADLVTPVMAYLRISKDATESFLFESVTGGETIGRYSFIGADPQRTLKSGPGQEFQGDPLVALQAQLSQYRYVKVPGVPSSSGGAIGYVAYDCVQYFEPKTARDLKDPLGIPESVFMICDSVIVFDHIYQTIKAVSHVFLPDPPAGPSSPTPAHILALYRRAAAKVYNLLALLRSHSTPLPPQPSIELPAPEAVSNVGKAGYEGFVTSLKKNIVKGDIIQAVPSQRLARPTKLHPFNVYRHLRQVNPSPYMFYVDCGNLQLVGASPETLCKVVENRVFNHAIAGTVKRGRDPAEDEELAAQLLASTKDQAEHVMLVDLARNDVNRVCQPKTVKVDSFMQVEKFSHVMHLTSQISGILREGKTRFDAFRSIFPAGTVSGAPKIRAIELISELEREKRGVYAGAVGRFDFADDSMDTCIAIRTMLFKDGVAYLQAGGGIVFDSVEEDEYVETINKLGANVRCIAQAEEYYHQYSTGRPV